VRRRLRRSETAAGEISNTGGTMTWLATDGAARFARVGSIFLGETLPPQSIEIVDL
jgi:hypothetical protein